MIDKVILYDTAICNLKCTYCYVSKNNGLKEVDKELEESFADKDYYINLTKTYLGNDLSHINFLEIWGAETLLHLDRTFNYIEQLINESPNFKFIMFSSNYAHDRVQDSFKGLMEVLGKYPQRKFYVKTQISLDGPTEITDASRGQGVTERLLNNLETLLQNHYYTPDNVHVEASIKGTIDKDQIVSFLDKDYTIKYYQFYENEVIDRFSKYQHSHVHLPFYPIPNFAVPASYTQEDGKHLAKIIRLQREIEEENKKNRVFKYYTNILWFNTARKKKLDFQDYMYSGAFCETGRKMIGLLPKGKTCSCHRAFADYCETYRNQFFDGVNNTSIMVERNGNNSIANKILCADNKEQFERHVERMSQFGLDAKDTSFMSANVNMIRMLAMTGQVDEKYLNPEEALEGMRKVLRIIPTCVYDNVTLCGTPILIPTYVFKLYFNGAIDAIYEGEENENAN